MNDIFFNAHHSPIGAYASLTLGKPGTSGGLGIELAGPANQEFFAGIEAEEEGLFELLPFWNEQDDKHEAARFQMAPDSERRQEPGHRVVIKPFECSSIRRDFQLGTDTWEAGDLTFTIYSPLQGIPDPTRADAEDMKIAIVPAITMDLTIDNSRCERPRRALIGYLGADPTSAMRRLDDTSTGQFIGIGQGRTTAIVTDEPDMRSALGFTLRDILSEEHAENLAFGLGVVGVLLVDVPAGERRTFRLAACFYRGGLVTTGLDCSYYYTRFFNNIEEVAGYVLAHSSERREAARLTNNRIYKEHLSDNQRFMLAHAIRSYYGNTELLNHGSRPVWVVNEGEYRMINTFDLTVDQLFFELRMNPWVVRNVLEHYVSRYSYYDEVRFPGEEETHPGGLSFTHDMGIANMFSRSGYSAYEKTGLHGCFSYMTSEQLVNWILCATTYISVADDQDWYLNNSSAFEECFESMLMRDHPDAGKRNGVMGLDSVRTSGGTEITTYDSLDSSLGQARNSLYLAVKSWAAYVALERLFESFDRDPLAAGAGIQAERCAETIAAALNSDGYVPALFEEGNDARVIPAIEGLVFPWIAGNRKALDQNGRFGDMIQALRTHVTTILKPGVCLFPDGGWKLSSTSNNSWLSKIYLCQFVVRRVFKLSGDDITYNADIAHKNWLLDPENSYWCWSDQMYAGKAIGSHYYPRGVTAILWLDEC